jgi:hypothetical protein
MARLRGLLIVVQGQSRVEDTPLAVCGSSKPFRAATDLLAGLDLVDEEEPRDVVVDGEHDVIGDTPVFCLLDARLAADHDDTDLEGDSPKAADAPVESPTAPTMVQVNAVDATAPVAAAPGAPPGETDIVTNSSARKPRGIDPTRVTSSAVKTTSSAKARKRAVPKKVVGKAAGKRSGAAQPKRKPTSGAAAKKNMSGSVRASASGARRTAKGAAVKAPRKR